MLLKPNWNLLNKMWQMTKGTGFIIWYNKILSALRLGGDGGIHANVNN